MRNLKLRLIVPRV